MDSMLQLIKTKASLMYACVFLTSALSDFFTSLYFYSVSHRWIVIQALIGFWLPFMNLLFAMLFIDATTVQTRLKLTFFSALGMTVGATIMLLIV